MMMINKTGVVRKMMEMNTNLCRGTEGWDGTVTTELFRGHLEEFIFNIKTLSCTFAVTMPSLFFKTMGYEMNKDRRKLWCYKWSNHDDTFLLNLGRGLNWPSPLYWPLVSDLEQTDDANKQRCAFVQVQDSKLTFLRAGTGLCTAAPPQSDKPWSPWWGEYWPASRKWLSLWWGK